MAMPLTRPRQSPGPVCQFYNRNFRSRNAFAITDTELKLIAAAAIIGLKSKPKTG